MRADTVLKKIPPLQPIVSEINSVDFLTKTRFKDHFNIILQSTSKLSKCALTSQFIKTNFYALTHVFLSTVAVYLTALRV